MATYHVRGDTDEEGYDIIRTEHGREEVYSHHSDFAEAQDAADKLMADERKQGFTSEQLRPPTPKKPHRYWRKLGE